MAVIAAASELLGISYPILRAPMAGDHQGAGDAETKLLALSDREAVPRIAPGVTVPVIAAAALVAELAAELEQHLEGEEP